MQWGKHLISSRKKGVRDDDPGREQISLSDAWYLGGAEKRGPSGQG